MAPRIPSTKTLEAELISTVSGIYNSEARHELSVNLVRQRVESKLGLKDGFFKEEDWKSKSKEIIKNTVDELESRVPPSSPAPEPSPLKATKRASPDEPTTTPVKKRRKTVSKPAPAASESGSEPDVSELSADASDAPRKKASKKKLAPREKKARRVVESEDEDERSSPVEDKQLKKDKSKPGKVPREKPPKSQDVVPSESESLLSELEEVEEEERKEEDPEKPAGGDESSESEVFDEPPKPKRKSKEPSAGKARGKSKASSGSKPVAEVSPDEAEIKKLQGQLVKCGVRKIWAFELKQYGDDSRAKIRHLKGMLKDVGMEGRFSEARAREIKERRELLADLEAVTEMNQNWGAEGGRGRTSRSRAVKKMKLPSDDEDEDEDEDGEGSGGSDNGDHSDEEQDGEDRMAKARARAAAKRRADMAFLGDESESD